MMLNFAKGIPMSDEPNEDHSRDGAPPSGEMTTSPPDNVTEGTEAVHTDEPPDPAAASGDASSSTDETTAQTEQPATQEEQPADKPEIEVVGPPIQANFIVSSIALGDDGSCTKVWMTPQEPMPWGEVTLTIGNPQLKFEVGQVYLFGMVPIKG